MRALIARRFPIVPMAVCDFDDNITGLATNWYPRFEAKLLLTALFAGLERYLCSSGTHIS